MLDGNITNRLNTNGRKILTSSVKCNINQIDNKKNTFFNV